MVKNLPVKQKLGLDPWVGKILWRRELQPTLVFLPEEFHRQRSLLDYSPWGHKESDLTEQLTHTQSKLRYFIFFTQSTVQPEDDQRSFAICIYSIAVIPNTFDTSDRFHGRQFFLRLAGGGTEVVLGWFKCIIFTVYFISIIIISTLPQIIRH